MCGEWGGGSLTSSTLRRMARNRVVSASRFLARSEWPVCAPLRRVLVFVSAIRVGKMDSRGPVPDMMTMRTDSTVEHESSEGTVTAHGPTIRVEITHKTTSTEYNHNFILVKPKVE